MFQLLKTQRKIILLPLLAALWLLPVVPADARTAEPVAEGEEPRPETDKAESPDRVVKERIVVSATAPDLPTESTVSGEELEPVPQPDLVGSLREAPGLSAVRRGAVNQEPSVRGLLEEQVATLVDGNRTFAAGPARMDSGLSHAGPHSAEEVHVVKGPYALTWGSGALSAIDVRTFRPAIGSGLKIRAGADGNENGDAVDTFGNLSYGGDRYRLFLSAGYRTGDDYEAGDGSLVPGNFESLDTRWRLGYQATESLLLDASGGYQEQHDLDYPGRILDAEYFYTRSYDLTADWTGDGPVAGVRGKLYGNFKDHRMTNDNKPTARDVPGRTPPFALEVGLPTESDTVGGRLRVDLEERGSVAWSFGADGYRLEQNAVRTVSRRSNGLVLFTDRVWPDARLEDLGAWGQATWSAGRSRLSATLRGDRADATADAPSEFFLANTSGDLDQEDTHWSGALSGTFNLADGWLLSAGLGRAVRAPTVLERYSDRFPSSRFQIAAEFLGHPDLDPEASTQLDLGLRYQPRPSTFVAVETFYRRIDDYITVATAPGVPRRLPLSPPTVYRYINGDRATFYGGELVVSHRADRWSLRGDVAYTRGEDEKLDEPALGVAPLTARLSGRYEMLERRLWLSAGGRWYDDQDRVAARRFEQPTEGAALLDLGLDLRLGRPASGTGSAGSWRLSLEVSNATDELYSYHTSTLNPFLGERVPEAGRSVRAGVRVDW